MRTLTQQTKSKFWQVPKIIALCAFLSVSGGHAAMAACTNPAGDTGDQVYNSSFDVMQYCDGTDWTAMRGDGDTLSSLTCTDGQIAKWNNTGTAWECSADGASGIAINDLTDSFADGSSLFLGSQASNDNGFGNNANLGVGHSALRNIISGRRNTAIGNNALYYNTTGEDNVALGYWTLYDNITGDENVAVGGYSLQDTIENKNTAVGYTALRFNTTGEYNVALGHYAGGGTTSTQNNLGTTSVFLGARTKSASNGTANEIVIGYNAVGAGSNSVVLGNDSITKTLLKGNVGIDDPTPDGTLKLDVNGQIGATEYCDENGGNCITAAALSTGGDTLAGLTCADGEVAKWNNTGSTWICSTDIGGGAGDNLGNHTATTNIQLGSNYLSGDGGAEGISVDSDGKVGIGTTSPTYKLNVHNDTAQTLVGITTDATLNSILNFFSDRDGTPKGGAIGYDYDEDVMKITYGTAFGANTDGISLNSNNYVGIGTSAANGPLHIRTVVDAGANTPSDAASLVIGDWAGSHMQIDNNEIIAMSNETTESTVYIRENVGIPGTLYSNGKLGVGDDDFDGTVTITGATDINGVNTVGQGGLVIQSEISNTAGYKMRIDTNEIQTSNNNAATGMILNPSGGYVSVGTIGSPSTFYARQYAVLGEGDVVQGLSVRRNVLINAPSTSYDVWIQGGEQTAGGDGRNLAFLGVDEDSGDYLRINYGGEYANGVTIESKLAVGGTDRDGTLTITGAPDINAANGAGNGGLVIQDNGGNTTGTKMRMDANEIQVSSNNAVASLSLNPYGGNVSLSGSNRGNSIIDMNGGRVRDMAAPSSASDAATKAYVDAAVQPGDSYLSNSVTTTSATTTLDLTCPGSSKIISGGCRGETNKLLISENFPVGDTKWRCKFYKPNTGTGAPSATGYAHAICYDF